LDSIRRETLSSTAMMGTEKYKHKKGLLSRRYTSIIYNWNFKLSSPLILRKSQYFQWM
jgi:hypothetical protein